MNASFTGRRSLSGGTFGRRPANPKTSELRQRTDECLHIRVHNVHTHMQLLGNLKYDRLLFARITHHGHSSRPTEYIYIIYIYMYVCLCVCIYTDAPASPLEVVAEVEEEKYLEME